MRHDLGYSINMCDNVESIDHRFLIHILTELMNRIEKLEAKQ